MHDIFECVDRSGMRTTDLSSYV